MVFTLLEQKQPDATHKGGKNCLQKRLIKAQTKIQHAMVEFPLWLCQQCITAANQ